MYRVILFLFFLLFNSSVTYSQKDSIEKSVIAFFNGLSELNADALRAHTTKDFILLEDGEVWNIDTLISKITPLKKRNFKRVNTFAFIATEQRGDVAWTSYHNTALFTIDDKQQARNWLESAVLIKEEGRWKINSLHSTKKK